MKHTKTLRSLAVVATAAIALTACDIDVKYELDRDANTNVTMAVSEDRAVLDTLGMGDYGIDDCESLFAEMDITDIESEGASLTDNSTDKTLSCEISGPIEKDDLTGQDVEINKDTIALTLDLEGTEQAIAAFQMLGSASNITLSFVMPGEIISAEGAEIDGNVATYNDITNLPDEIRVEAFRDGNGGGFPWLWLVLGLVLVVAIATAIVLFNRKKNKSELSTSGNPYLPADQQPGATNYPQGTNYPGGTAPAGYTSGPVPPNSADSTGQGFGAVPYGQPAFGQQSFGSNATGQPQLTEQPPSPEF